MMFNAAVARPAKRVRFEADSPESNKPVPAPIDATHPSASSEVLQSFTSSQSSSTVDGDKAKLYSGDILNYTIKTSPITIHDFILDDDNIPHAEVELTAILWQKAKDIRDTKCFSEFLKRCSSWEHFIQAKEMSSEKYYQPRRWVKATQIENIIGMELVGNQWMVCIQAIVRTWIKPEDWKGDEQLEQAVIRFCETREDWTSLYE